MAAHTEDPRAKDQPGLAKVLMRTKKSKNLSEFAGIESLRADGPHSEHREDLMLFGQFVGEWRLDVSFYEADGSLQRQCFADWIFSWILQGKAIQDVLVVPSREERAKNPDASVKSGTTLRYYNHTLGAWRVLFLGPHTNTYISLIGRQQGKKIVLEGPDVDGSPLRWVFSEITPNSFLWTGHISKDGGNTWYMEQKMTAKRRTRRTT